MFIIVSTGSCRLAVAAAIAAEEAKLAKDTEEFKANSFQRLHDGAVHNGLSPTQTELDNMKSMVARDVDHAMLQHPGHKLLQLLRNYSDMLDYVDSTSEDSIVIDDTDFHILGPHLTNKAAAETGEFDAIDAAEGGDGKVYAA